MEALFQYTFPAVCTLVTTWILNRKVEKVHSEVKTNDGKRQGDYVEATAKAIARVEANMLGTRALLEEHIGDRKAHVG